MCTLCCCSCCRYAGVECGWGGLKVVQVGAPPGRWPWCWSLCRCCRCADDAFGVCTHYACVAGNAHRIGGRDLRLNRLHPSWCRAGVRACVRAGVRTCASMCLMSNIRARSVGIRAIVICVKPCTGKRAGQLSALTSGKLQVFRE